MFDYQHGQKVKARIFGGWKKVTVVNADDSWVRVRYEHGAVQRDVTIYDPRLIQPCPQPKSHSLTCPGQQSFDL